MSALVRSEPGTRPLDALRHLPRCVWGTIGHPRSTFDELAAQASTRPAVVLVGTTLLLGWLNMLLFAAFGYDWLGTRRELLDPTYVGLFGRLRIGLENWVPLFAVLHPVSGLLALALVAGVAHGLSKWMLAYWNQLGRSWW